MHFEESYELAAAKLKGYHFKPSSFCHRRYPERQFRIRRFK